MKKRKIRSISKPHRRSREMEESVFKDEVQLQRRIPAEVETVFEDKDGRRKYKIRYLDTIGVVFETELQAYNGNSINRRCKVGQRVLYAPNVTYRKGDFVLIRKDRENRWKKLPRLPDFVYGELDRTLNAIAEILCIWQENEKVLAEIRWFYWPSVDETSLPYSKLGISTSGYEILATQHVDIIDFDCIHHKIKVLDESRCNVSKEIKKRESSDYDTNFNYKLLFFCRFFYDHLTKLHRPIHLQINGRKYSKMLPNIVDSAAIHHAAKKKKNLDSSSKEREFNVQLQLAHTELQLSSVPKSLPCREKERKNVYDFLKESILSGGLQRTLYIAGLPGTGKTATVHEVISSLQQEAQEEKLSTFDYVEVNAMRLGHPRHAYREICSQLTGEYHPIARAHEILQERFLSPKKEYPVCLLLVDEIDFLSTRKQTVLYNLFDWPTHPKSRLVLIGIANTMDLPERLLPKISSRASMQRVDFKPYTPNQIQEIIVKRLEHLKVFEQVSIEITARQVSSSSGDIRRALQICRLAVEKKLYDNSMSRITIRDVKNAKSELTSNDMVLTIKNLSLFERIFIVALVKELHSTGLDNANFVEVYRRFVTFYTTKQRSSWPKMKHRSSEILKMCMRLNETGVLQVFEDRTKRFPDIALKCLISDVEYAFREDRDVAGELPRN